MAFLDEIIRKSQEAYNAFTKLCKEENGGWIKIKVKTFEEKQIVYKTFWVKKKKFETIKEAIKKLYLFDKVSMELTDENRKTAFWGDFYYNPPLKEWVLKIKKD